MTAHAEPQPDARREMGEAAAQAAQAAASAYAARPQKGYSSLHSWSDERTIAAMRLLLAVSAFIVSVLAPLGPETSRLAIFLLLVLYSLYSGVVLWIARRRSTGAPAGTHWIDIGWYTAFTACGGGITSSFFSFYYFAILVASFRGGFTSGLRVTVASAVLFLIVGYLAIPADDPLPLNRLLLRPVFLLVIGFLMARWGNLEILEKRRLLLLKEISGLANPRFGEGETIRLILERLRAFHDADTAMLVVADAASRTFSARRCDRESAGSVRELQLDAEAGGLLTRVPWTHAAIVTGRDVRVLDLHGDAAAGSGGADAGLQLSATLASLLECRSFISVPFRYDAGAMARVYITSARPRVFATGDIEFLVHVFDHVMPAVERLRLLDRLAIDAATHERERLARDLHDSVIQPYIGLQMGISAALEHARQRHDVVGTLEHLLDAAQNEIAGLRHYARDLKNHHDASGGFVAGLRRIASRFSEVTNIHVQVSAPDHLAVQDRLAAEVFQMIAEGVSNVRRHTTADCAFIRLERHSQRLLVEIENPGGPGMTFRPFLPRSLSERASALGGAAHVSGRPDGGAVVHVEIPV